MELYNLEEMREAKRNDDICKGLGAALVRAYPNRQFYVEVHDKGQLATIKIPSISMKYGMTIKLAGLLEWDEKKAIKAAGEHLERFFLTRGRTDNHDVLEIEKNIAGEAVNAKKGEL